MAETQPNTLRLNPTQLLDVWNRLDRIQSDEQRTRRQFVRWPFRRASVTLHLTYPGMATAEICVACRNLSRQGLAVLHRAFVHPGTRCTVWLPHPDGRQRAVTGQVVWCLHRTSMIHEVGIAFDQPIDVHEFVPLDPLDNWTGLEQVNPEQLAGMLLHADPSLSDRRVVRHYLKQTQVRVCETESVSQTQAHLHEGWDLIICDWSLVEGTNLLADIRQWSRAPVIVTVPNALRANRQVLLSVPADAFLTKPLEYRRLLLGVAEFLIVRRGSRTRPDCRPGT